MRDFIFTSKTLRFKHFNYVCPNLLKFEDTFVVSQSVFSFPIHLKFTF